LEIFVPERQSPVVWACGKNAAVLKDIPVLSSLELSGRVQRLVQKPTNQFDNLYIPSVRIVLTSSTTPTRTAFKMSWTELFHLPRNADGSEKTSKLVDEQRDKINVLTKFN